MRIQVFIATLFVVFLSLPQFAHAQLSADSTADIRIDADDAVNRNGVTILTGQVDIRQADARLLADKVEIFSDRNSGTSLITSDAITRMVATGNFFYITPDQEVRGDKGIYTADTESFVVTGDVILLQDDSVVTGSQLNYNLQTRDAKVVGNCNGRKCPKRDRVAILIRSTEQ